MRERIIVMNEGELEALIEKVVRRVILERDSKNEPPIRFPMLLSLEDAALFLNLAPQTIYGFTSKRLIPFIKKGKRLYFKKAELEEWLEDGKKKSISQIEKELE